MLEGSNLTREQKEKKNNLDLIALALKYGIIPEDKGKEIISAIENNLLGFQETQMKIFTLLRDRGIALSKIKDDPLLSEGDRLSILTKEKIIEKLFKLVVSGKAFLSE